MIQKKRKITKTGVTLFLLTLLLTFQFPVLNAHAEQVEALKSVENVLLDNTLLHRHDGIQKMDTSSSTAVVGTVSSVESANSTRTSVTKPAVAPHKKNNTPNRIVATFNGDTRTQMGFNWYTSDKLDDAAVWVSESKTMTNPIMFPAEAKLLESHYVERTAAGYIIFSKVKTDESGNQTVVEYFTDEGKVGQSWDPKSELGDDKSLSYKVGVQKVTEASYKALATGLKPNTKYYYQVGSEHGEKSPVGQFQTSGNRGEKFTLVHYTDTQNAYWNEHARNEAAYGASTLEKALETAPDASFVIHTGDIVEIAEVEDEWVDLLEQSQKSILSKPWAPTPGNHDEYALNYDELFPEAYNNHFNVPAAQGKIDGGSYYSYDYNGVHFVVANTNDYKNPDKKALGEEQLAWIREDVQDARKRGAKWVVLQYHKPLFSKSYHSLQDEDVQNVREDFMKLIDELDIDLAIQGHDHVISRTKSLNYAPKEESFVNARIDYAEITLGEDRVEYYKDPQGTTFILPNTGGTKAYDAIYDKSLEHIKTVRPKLNWLTQEQLDHYNSLFAYGKQPQKSEAFKKSHGNKRDSSEQNFAVYEFDNNQMNVKIYQVYGDLFEGEPRQVKLVDEFGIQKSK